MTPLLPEQLFFAIQAGVPADLILRLGVGSLNALRNERATASGYIPADPQFLRVTTLLRNLQVAGLLQIRFSDPAKDGRGSGQAQLCLPVTAPTPETTTQLSELRTLLRLDRSHTELNIVGGSGNAATGEIAVRTFSIMHLLASLAARVEIPSQDITEHRATKGLSEALAQDGGATEMAVTDEAGFLVKNAETLTQPEDAFTAVRYRNRWFWIDDRDLGSKRILSLIVLMFTLADPGAGISTPVVTIPAH